MLTSEMRHPRKFHIIVYRLNTFPLIHLNIFHAILNILALTPLMERFEAEFGTLTSLSLFFGRESLSPSIYTREGSSWEDAWRVG